MIAVLAVRCPAKINTVLRVVGRRPDGFHELDTEFVSLELSDRLVMTPAEAFSLSVIGPMAGGVPTEDNLVLRAARCLQRHVGHERLAGARLRLEKHVPAAAGLGGGSSDAAGALLGLVRLHQLDVPTTALQELALELGSDVPYFLRGGWQRGCGRGEQLTPLADRPGATVLLVRPRSPLSTARVFQAHARRAIPGDGAGAGASRAREGAPRGEGPVAFVDSLTSRKIETSFSEESSWERADALLLNDLWPAALELLPEIGDVARQVRALLPGAAVGMSGSGPTLFALVAGLEPRAVEHAAAHLRREGLDVWLTRTQGAVEYGRSRFDMLPAWPEDG